MKVGQHVLIIKEDFVGLRWAKVTKLGRKYGYCGKLRFDLQSLKLVDSGGRVFATAEDYRDYRHQCDMRFLLRRKILWSYGKLSMETVKQCLQEIGVELPPRPRVTIPRKPKA